METLTPCTVSIAGQHFRVQMLAPIFVCRCAARWNSARRGVARSARPCGESPQLTPCSLTASLPCSITCVADYPPHHVPFAASRLYATPSARHRPPSANQAARSQTASGSATSRPTAPGRSVPSSVRTSLVPTCRPPLQSPSRSRSPSQRCTLQCTRPRRRTATRRSPGLRQLPLRLSKRDRS